MNKGYFITIMIALVTWIALTCLWAGSMSTEVNNIKGHYNSLTNEVRTLNSRLNRTNQILYLHLPKEAKEKIRTQ